MSPEVQDFFFHGYRTVQQAEKFLEDELVSRLLGRYFDPITKMALPPQTVDQAVRGTIDRESGDYQKKVGARGIDGDVPMDNPDDDTSSARGVIKAPPMPPNTTADETPAMQQRVLQNKPGYQPDIHPIQQSDPEAMSKVTDRFARFRLAEVPTKSWLDIIRQYMGGDALVRSVLAGNKGDAEATFQELLPLVQTKLRKLGYSKEPRVADPVAAEPTPVRAPQPDPEVAPQAGQPPEVEPVVPAADAPVIDEPTADAPVIDEPTAPPTIDDIVGQYVKGGEWSISKMAQRLSDEHGIQATPQQVRDAAAKALGNNADSAAGESDDDDEQMTVDDVEGYVNPYVVSGIMDPRKIAAMISKKNGVEIPVELIAAAIDQMLDSGDSRLDNKDTGGDDIGDEEEEKEKEQDASDAKMDPKVQAFIMDRYGKSPEKIADAITKKWKGKHDVLPDDVAKIHQAVTEIIVANAKTMRPDDIAGLIQKQLGIYVDDDVVQSIMTHLVEKGKIKFEAFSFRNWMEKRSTVE
jgi:hypothetical protein